MKHARSIRNFYVNNAGPNYLRGYSGVPNSVRGLNSFGVGGPNFLKSHSMGVQIVGGVYPE